MVYRTRQISLGSGSTGESPSPSFLAGLLLRRMEPQHRRSELNKNPLSHPMIITLLLPFNSVSFEPLIGFISIICYQPQLSVDGATYGGSYFTMVLSLLDFFPMYIDVSDVFSAAHPLVLSLCG